MSFITRRRFLQLSGTTAAAAAGVGLYTWRWEPHWVEFVERPLDIAGLPASLVGKTLVQISDVHVGERVDDDFVIGTFRRIQALEPDIVVMTGDYLTYYADVFSQLEGVYRHFPLGRLATIGILGNHDYGPGWNHSEIAARVVDTMSPFGIRILRNEIHDVDGLHIAGLDDWWAHQFNARQTLSSLRPGAPAVVLSHNPDTVDLPVWGNYQGWILAGHTHGGQCKPPFLPPPLLPVNNRRYTSGDFDLTGNRRLYINRGVGHLLRVRFNVRPEVTIHHLQRV